MNKIWPMLLAATLSVNTLYAQSNSDRYQEILDEAQRNGLPGIAALVQSPGEKEWRGKSGFRNIENAIPLDINQNFRLASISKIFTSIIVLQLVDENSIKLSDSISKYLDAETQAIIPNVNSITVLHLLSHSSGIYSFTENNSFWKECYLNGGMSRTWSPNEILQYIENKKPVSKPLEPFSKKLYSNTNYILLGMIIEKVTGNLLNAEYQNRIFTPLGMNDTFLEGYDSQDRKPVDSYAIANSSFLKSAVKKHDLQKAKGSQFINLSQTYDQFNSWAWAAGGISSNLNDLRSFFASMRNNELLNDDTQKMLIRLNSSEDKGITFFGGTGGSDGIQATMLHLMPSDVVIMILINSSGNADANLGSVFSKLLAVASN
ncbi:serine hydrolase domain-containing protein [Roseivirga sp.]|uniref:serine hydrolase domain-containing protein n=1 Tax=Roseivirga sp. TaxID=1964215 RepID=UPI002B27AF72|nr:serine hydrolase domain-containing protein [Roseivirga sp.]